MQPLFEELLRIMCSGRDPSVSTDNSILLVYPPDRELDFRDELLDRFVPALQQEPCNFALVDASTLLFRGFTDAEIAALEEDEFDDYAWMLKGMSQRVEAALSQEILRAAAGMPSGNVIVYNTMALYPAIRFGDVLPGLRSIPAGIVIAFPGEERGGKLHFMAHADGGNYLAVKLFWK
jgi:hypothetical protein